MKILVSWLREFARLHQDASVTADRLTRAGLEVEEQRDFDEMLAAIRCAEVRRVDKHPNADRLSVCTVFDGETELQVVCGAPNVKEGAHAALAPVGAVLPNGMEIAETKIRGVLSSGMLCSESELGLAERSSGILLLENARPGQPVTHALGLAGETLMVLGLTPNRPDCLSHAGVAREAAALLRAQFSPRPSKLEEGDKAAADVSGVTIEDAERCPRYALRIVEGVKVGPSPVWLRQRLELCGVRAINNVVDATNYVLLELGHPLHAFDLDKLAESRIVVRCAKPGEKLTTLDGQARTLDADDLVIADAERPQALAGVMGGADSEVSEDTQRILLESAYFERRGVRRTSKRHGLHTEASHRFERGADPEAVITALDRVAELITAVGGGTVLAGAVDAYPRPVLRPAIHLRWKHIESLLGVAVSETEAIDALARLGVSCRSRSESEGVFDPPSWRPDLERDVDLIEEIARLRGYERIPSALPLIRLQQAPKPPSALRAAVRAGSEALRAAGLSEAINFSFVAPRMVEGMHYALGDPRSNPIPLQNPLSEDLSVLRTSLVPGLLQNALHNLRHGVRDVRLFEVGRVFLRAEGEILPREHLLLSGLLVGRRARDWNGQEVPVDFYDAKGAAQQALRSLGWTSPTIASARRTWLHPRATAEVRVGKTVVGELGEVHPEVRSDFDLAAPAFVFELDLSKIVELHTPPRSLREIDKFPAVYRDLAVVVDHRVTWEALREQALAVDPKLTRDIEVFDVYVGKPVPEGKKSVAFAITYQASDRTLTDEEVGRVHDGIRRRLEERLGARMRE